MKSLTVQTLFELKNECKDKEWFYNNFRYKWMLRYIKNDNIKGLKRKLLKCSSQGRF